VATPKYKTPRLGELFPKGEWRLASPVGLGTKRSDRQVGSVGNNAIGTESNESLHFLGVIDGPVMNFNAVLLNLADETGRVEAKASLVGRDLQRAYAGECHAQQNSATEFLCECGPESSETARASSDSGEFGSGSLAASVTKTGDQHPSLRTVFRDYLGSGRNRTDSFEVKVEASLGEGLQSLGQGGDRSTVLQLEGL
jgi:hypothetical protein